MNLFFEHVVLKRWKLSPYFNQDPHAMVDTHEDQPVLSPQTSPAPAEKDKAEDQSPETEVFLQIPELEFKRLLDEHQMKLHSEAQKNHQLTCELENLRKALARVNEEKDILVNELSEVKNLQQSTYLTVQQLEDTVSENREQLRERLVSQMGETSRLSNALAQAQKKTQEVMERMIYLENSVHELQRKPKKKKSVWRTFLQKD
ncbi:hypothetical protein JOB18_049727 [Solea senegalensis]|uniref:Uncharacterized protein n=1 Tax=Solea senegalensis TaxID=28829 RepID=A0AAV6RY62_SOLSE|nr:hypothetical protein JOB18_049727 [Solea senegalensis]